MAANRGTLNRWKRARRNAGLHAIPHVNVAKRLFALESFLILLCNLPLRVPVPEAFIGWRGENRYPVRIFTMRALVLELFLRLTHTMRRHIMASCPLAYDKKGE